MRLIVGNWKANGSWAENAQWVESMKRRFGQQSLMNTQMVICPPSVYIAQMSEHASNDFFEVGAQNVGRDGKGAHTGELSVSMLAEMGCRWVIIGHSERRQDQSESDGDIQKKAQQAANGGLRAIYCIGETAAQRSSGEALKVLEQQLSSLFESDEKTIRSTVIAYEPVWAIGTGESASVEQVRLVHRHIRSCCEKQLGGQEKIPVLYGGSVNEVNAESLLNIENVDGFLVGGASLDAEKFHQICTS